MHLNNFQQQAAASAKAFTTQKQRKTNKKQNQQGHNSTCTLISAGRILKKASRLQGQQKEGTVQQPPTHATTQKTSTIGDAQDPGLPG